MSQIPCDNIDNSSQMSSFVSSSSVDSSTDNSSQCEPGISLTIGVIPTSTLNAYSKQFKQIIGPFSANKVSLSDCERLLKSQFSLDDTTFDLIWSISDMDRDNSLDEIEYCIFLHIANSHKLHHKSLPSQKEIEVCLKHIMSQFDSSRASSGSSSGDEIESKNCIIRQSNTLLSHETMPQTQAEHVDIVTSNILSDPSIVRARPTPSKFRLASQDSGSMDASEISEMGPRNLSSDRLLNDKSNEIFRLPPPTTYPVSGDVDEDSLLKVRDIAAVKQSQTLQIGFNPINFKKGHKRASSMGSNNSTFSLSGPNFTGFPSNRTDGIPPWKGQIVSNSFASSSPIGENLVKSLTNATVTPPGNRKSSQACSISSSHRERMRNEPGVVTFQDEASNDIEALLPSPNAQGEVNLLSGSAFRAPSQLYPSEQDNFIKPQRTLSCSSKEAGSDSLGDNSSINNSVCESSSDSSYVFSDGCGGTRLIRPTSYAQALDIETDGPPNNSSKEAEAPVHISKRADPIQVLSAATGRPGNLIAKLEPIKRRKLLKSLVREAKLMNHILLRLNNELQGEIQELSDQRLNLSVQLQHLGLLDQNANT